MSALLGGALTATLALAPTPAFAAAPANDNFAAGAVIPAAGGTFGGSNIDATAEPGEPAHAVGAGSYDEPFHSVWWTWTATVSGVAEISTCGSQFNTRLGVYTGSTVSSLTEKASSKDGNDQDCADARWAVASFFAEAGTTYHIAVDTEAGIDGDFSGPTQGAINLVLTAPPGDYGPPPTGAPQNDNFASAAPMPEDGGEYVGTNEGATAETGEPNHGHSTVGEAVHSIWYQWTATKSGQTKISTCGSDFDTRVGVYTGSAVNALTEVAWNEDGNDASCTNPKFAVVTFNATAGTTYFFAVDTSGWITSESSGPPVGTARITLTPPTGDEPTDDDTNPGTEVTETPYELTIPRFKPVCNEAKKDSAADCPRNATNLYFWSVENYQTWDKRNAVVRKWVETQRSKGADITFISRPLPSNVMDGAIMKYLRTRASVARSWTRTRPPARR